MPSCTLNDTPSPDVLATAEILVRLSQARSTPHQVHSAQTNPATFANTHLNNTSFLRIPPSPSPSSRPLQPKPLHPTTLRAHPHALHIEASGILAPKSCSLSLHEQNRWWSALPPLRHADANAAVCVVQPGAAGQARVRYVRQKTKCGFTTPSGKGKSGRRGGRRIVGGSRGKKDSCSGDNGQKGEHYGTGQVQHNSNCVEESGDYGECRRPLPLLDRTTKPATRDWTFWDPNESSPAAKVPPTDAERVGALRWAREMLPPAADGRAYMLRGEKYQVTKYPDGDAEVHWFADEKECEG